MGGRARRSARRHGRAVARGALRSTGSSDLRGLAARGPRGLTCHLPSGRRGRSLLSPAHTGAASHEGPVVTPAEEGRAHSHGERPSLVHGASTHHRHKLDQWNCRRDFSTGKLHPAHLATRSRAFALRLCRSWCGEVGADGGVAPRSGDHQSPGRRFFFCPASGGI